MVLSSQVIYAPQETENKLITPFFILIIPFHTVFSQCLTTWETFLSLQEQRHNCLALGVVWENINLVKTLGLNFQTLYHDMREAASALVSSTGLKSRAFLSKPRSSAMRSAP